MNGCDSNSYHRQFATQTLKNQETILAALQISSRNDRDITNGMQAVLQHVVAQGQASNDKHWQRELQASMVQQVYQTTTPGNTSRIVLTTQKIEWMNRVMLSALEYTGMEDRHDQIQRSFETTFDWVLNEGEYINQKWHSLPKWLASNESIYWISGKPGSGKSTLMKYLSSSLVKSESGSVTTSRCHPILEKWAGEKRLIVAPFYFWASDASQMQKSRAGLLRTLLHHILAARTDLIPTVLLSRWEALAIAGEHEQLRKWTDTELHGYLICASQALGTSESCVCFFIDGLDEFDDDPKLLIDLVHSLSALGDYVKLCVASRPWIEFQDAFAPERHLLVEDLTHNDIRFFVAQKFNSNQQFVKLQILEAWYADKLIEDVVSKGAGVFLWVAMVVSSLLAGITNADRIEDLQRRLELIPPDLESLYGRILAASESFYHEHRAHMIVLMEPAKGALPLLVFALADESNFSSLTMLPPEPMRSTVLDTRMNAMHRRLNSRWKGLLEVSNEGPANMVPKPVVEYLHRSVKDFVQSSRMQDYLSMYTNPSFDPHFQLCLAYCGYVKAQQDESNRLINARLALLHAKQVSMARQEELMEMIIELASIPQLTDLLPPSTKFWFIFIDTQVGRVAYLTSVEDPLDFPFEASGDITKVHLDTDGMDVDMSQAMRLGFLLFSTQNTKSQSLRQKIAKAYGNSLPPILRLSRFFT